MKEMKKIELLDLQSNRIMEIPSWICEMDRLKELWLYDNQVTTIRFGQRENETWSTKAGWQQKFAVDSIIGRELEGTGNLGMRHSIYCLTTFFIMDCKRWTWIITKVSQVGIRKWDKDRKEEIKGKRVKDRDMKKEERWAELGFRNETKIATKKIKEKETKIERKKIKKKCQR